MYIVSTPPVNPTTQELMQYLDTELQQIAGELALIAAGNVVEPRNVAPGKPRNGMFAIADGTNWNPGSGAGAYCYYGAAWHFLG
jgi:hypothetical protein